MSYKPDRIERRNRRKAIFLTSLLYGGLLTFFVVKDDINWKDYMPAAVLEIMGEEPVIDATVAETTEIRP